MRTGAATIILVVYVQSMPDTSLQKILVQTIDTKVNEKHVRELRRELRLDFSEEVYRNANESSETEKQRS